MTQTGSFNKKGKRAWVELFFKSLNNNNLMNVLANFSEIAVDDSLPELAEFICRGYISNLLSEQEKVRLFSRCRYILALRKGSEGYKLPPTLRRSLPISSLESYVPNEYLVPC